MNKLHKVALAEKQQDEYRPRPDIRERLGDISITLLIGPTAIGKSHLIKKILELDSQFSESGTITNRPGRETDPNNYITNVPLETMLNRIEKQDFVQYGVVLPEKIYATDLDSYPSSHILLPALASSVDNFKKYGFKKVTPIGVLTSGEEWQERLKERRGSGDYENRLREAIASIQWLLQKYPTVPIVENRDGEDEETAREIIELSKDQAAIPAEASKRRIVHLGQGLLSIAEKELVQLGHE